MATTQRHGKPFIWVTWITKVLAGELQCAYQPWFKAHFQYDKRVDGFDTAAWTAEHTAQVQQRAELLRQTGYTVFVEAENQFRLKGTTAVFGGKPDLRATNGQHWLVIDVKTGTQRASDWWQVLAYMVCLPLAFEEMRGQTIIGEVQYPNGGFVTVQPEELTGANAERIWSTIKAIATGERPATTPSFGDCRFCDIAECQDRVTEETAVLVSEF